MSETYGIETSGASGRVVCMIEDQYVNIIGLPVGSARAQLVLSKDAQRIPRRLALPGRSYSVEMWGRVMSPAPKERQ